MARSKLHVLVAWLVTGIATAGDVWFEGIGHLAGTVVGSSVNAISDDGRIVTGWANSLDGQRRVPVTWTREGGLEALGEMAGAMNTDPSAISSDGSIIAGTVRLPEGVRAFRWTSTGGYELLGILDGQGSIVSGMSADGQTIVGSIEHPGGDYRAMRWTAAEGLHLLLINPSEDPTSLANGINRAGTAIVGTAYFNGGYGASRWQGDSPPEELTGPDGSSFYPGYVSEDTQHVLGYNLSASGSQAAHWVEEVGLAVLGDLPGGTVNAVATSMSPSGSIILGAGTTDVGREAFFWDASRGMRRLSDVLLSDYGLVTDGWTLQSAKFSADGSVIAGRAINPDGLIEGYVIRIPEPHPLIAIAFGGILLVTRRSAL